MRQFSLLASRRTDQLEPLSRGDGKTEITADLPGYIPVNAAGHRVDANIIQPPTQSCLDDYREHKIWNGRVGSCHDFHVGDGCNGQACLYDHSAVSDDVLSVLLFEDAEHGVVQAVHHWEMGRLRNGSVGYRRWIHRKKWK
jgi:hypothetical protein